MSEDIFISYRRGDAESLAARSLHDRLREEFAVYLDLNRESNPLGGEFGRSIEAALASCRVVFALIGQQWVSDEGLDRLNQPDDWVRRELAMALGRGDAVRVIPLFLGKVQPPDPSRLPEDVRRLLELNGRKLEPADWDSDVGELVRGLQTDWLTVRRGHTAPRPEVPHMLPYLCDRSEHQDAIGDIIQGQPRTAPLACVVHGHKWEAHDEFLDRLRYQKELEELLGAREEGVAVHAIQLNRNRLNDGRHRDALFSALKAAVLRRRLASDAELLDWFLKLPQPLVVVAQLTLEDLDSEGGNPIDGLVDAWRSLSAAIAPSSEGTAVGMPMRCTAVLWINLTYDEVASDFEPGGPVKPIRLTPVKSSHIREWLLHDEVKHHVARKKRELEDLAEHESYCFARGLIHMRTFADAVRDILARD